MFALFVLMLLAASRRQVVQPIDRLVTAAVAVAAGDHNRNVGIDGPDEIQRLHTAFNKMVVDLRSPQHTVFHDCA